MRDIPKATDTFERLRRQFPDSPYLEEIPKLPPPAEIPDVATPAPTPTPASLPPARSQPGGGAR
jgi:hypothetical protein